MLCGLVGGPGLVSGGNYNGFGSDSLAVFEQATRNAGKAIAGKNIANPTAYMVATSKVILYSNMRQEIHRGHLFGLKEGLGTLGIRNRSQCNWLVKFSNSKDDSKVAPSGNQN